MHIYNMFKKFPSLKSVMTRHSALLRHAMYGMTTCVRRNIHVSVIEHHNISDHNILMNRYYDMLCNLIL